MKKAEGGKNPCAPVHKDCVNAGRRKFHWGMPQAKGYQNPKGGLSNYPAHGPNRR
jgi:hypothetical protein